MANNCLKLNEKKARLECQQLNKIAVRLLTLLNATVQFAKVVNDLGFCSTISSPLLIHILLSMN